MSERPTSRLRGAALDAALRFHSDLMVEARRIVDAGNAHGVLLRLTGGLAVRHYALDLEFAERAYSDIDLIGLKRQVTEIGAVFGELGYLENKHVAMATCNGQLQFFTPPAVAGTGRNRLIRETLDGLLIVARDRRLSGPLLLGIVGAAYLVVPEAVAAPYAASLGAGAGGVGMIMAAAAGGSVLGAVVLGRLVPPLLRRRLMWPLALAGCLPLVLVVSRPGLGVTRDRKSVV